jgi:hypothetical protein
MVEENLWAVFLGGKIRQGALVENHDLMSVISETPDFMGEWIHEKDSIDCTLI